MLKYNGIPVQYPIISKCTPQKLQVAMFIANKANNSIYKYNYNFLFLLRVIKSMSRRIIYA